jgi:hypothetical protein
MNFVDHVNESPGSPLSYFYNFRGLSSVEQKIGSGRKFIKIRKSLKSSTRMKGKIAKNDLTEF